MRCELCGGRLESFEGEHYCPDCTCYATEQHALQAYDEARAVHLWLEQIAGADDAQPGDGPPF